MKVLCVFIDMLRTNLLNIYNSNNQNTKFDDLMRKLNGTFYNNAFTPSPDTPRSCGCLWSSCYPKYNGCNTRLKYPKFYLDNNKNFLSVLKDSNYEFNFYCNKGTLNLGIFPEGYPEIANLSKDEILEEYLKRLEIKDNNSLTFIYLPDYHATCDGYYASLLSHIEGLRYANGALETINSITPFDGYDLVVIFSDHGFKLSYEPKGILNQLNRNRTQTFLYIIDNNKKNKNMITSNKLVSIMDIGTTILNYCGLTFPYSCNGVDIINSEGHNEVIIEDHKDFGVDLGQTVVYYGLRNKKGLFTTDCSLNYSADYKYTKEDVNIVMEHLKENASFFEENLKQQRILDLYAEEIAVNVYHYNGDKKVYKFNFKIWLTKSIKKIVKAILKPFL